MRAASNCRRRAFVQARQVSANPSADRAEPLNAAVDSVFRQMRQVLFAIDIVLQTWGACVTPPYHFAKSLRSAVQFGWLSRHLMAAAATSETDITDSGYGGRSCPFIPARPD